MQEWSVALGTFVFTGNVGRNYIVGALSDVWKRPNQFTTIVYARNGAGFAVQLYQPTVYFGHKFIAET